jgi:purine-binding chemotaxis protein CheW
MSGSGMLVPDRIAELRRAFDRSFAEASESGVTPLEDLLEITIGATPYALRIAELSGLFADVRMTPLPTPVPELIGIAGFRGSVLPVYDLAAILGFPRARNPRWLAIAAARPVGLAFEQFDRHQRILRNDIVPQSAGSRPLRHVREMFPSGERIRAIVCVASVLEAITSRVPPGATQREP